MVEEGENMMKKIGFLTLIITSYLNSCPTCVGKITHKSPPFFSDSFYAPEQKKSLNSSNPEETGTLEDNEKNTQIQSNQE